MQELEGLRAAHDTLGEEHRKEALGRAQAEAREIAAVEALREVQLENASLLSAARMRDGSLSSQLGELQTRSISVGAAMNAL